MAQGRPSEPPERSCTEIGAAATRQGRRRPGLSRRPPVRGFCECRSRDLGESPIRGPCELIVVVGGASALEARLELLVLSGKRDEPTGTVAISGAVNIRSETTLIGAVCSVVQECRKVSVPTSIDTALASSPDICRARTESSIYSYRVGMRLGGPALVAVMAILTAGCGGGSPAEPAGADDSASVAASEDSNSAAPTPKRWTRHRTLRRSLAESLRRWGVLAATARPGRSRWRTWRPNLTR